MLNFVIRFLEGLCEINDESLNKDGALKVIATLRKCVGTGKVPTGFQQLVEKIEEKVGEMDKKVLSRAQKKLKEVFDEFKEIKVEGTGTSISGQSQAVQDFLGKVEDALETNNSARKNKAALTYSSLQSNIEGVTKATTNLTNEIRRINTTTEKANLIPNAAVFTAVRDAATAFIADINEPIKYTSYYDAAWSKVSSDDEQTKCAKIFLGCLPLYYQALTYIYWGCHEKGGGRRNLTLAGGALKSYFDSQGFFSPYVDTNKRGAHIAESALKGFSEFTQGMSGASSSSPFTYVSFTKKLQEKVTTNGKQISEKCPLSALFHGASCYFQCQQIKVADKASRSPQTIREMLYFLAALQFSPQYEAFDGYVTSHFQTMTGSPSKDDVNLKLQVADSGSPSSSDTLSAADVKSYLASTFSLAPAFIGLIQEPSSLVSLGSTASSVILNSILAFRNPAPVFSVLFPTTVMASSDIPHLSN
ncbi:variant erythrocyte surface antigen-1 family protein [Babesia caballi]|uniref:Variant erythrocyte surface antigen-1 family protein n=1 Tax=Babesia caballi TaxID=5871 RepID=A0AAV4LUF5_BABCB|nr:variant erythrocyte surface antigen-1 family protein [Babesia caballi]